ncbi:leucine-rich repeat domain-containing protein [Chryseobacterium artocarpi]|uniref:leucine-rich repeat domain-containing protein n=1 Tax=Chryseobacterium artocarpi TaxID=1414727 RepID=UPI003F39348E
MSREVERIAESYGINKDSYYCETNSSGEVISLELYEPEYDELSDADRESHLQFAGTLNKLERLEISFYDYELSDLSFLSNLINLKELSLDCNSQFSSLGGFLHLTELEALYIQGSIIESIDEIYTFHKLEYLNIVYSKIKDISSLEKLSGTLKGLYLSDNQIEDISCLTSLYQLEYFHASKNKITNIPDLTALKNLKEITLNDNKIKSFDGLSNLKNLKKIEASDNQVENIDLLSNLNGIEELYVRNNLISDISSVQNLTCLLNLDISDNKIVSLSPLNHLKKLSFLSCNNSKIKDFDQLKLSSQLKFLYLNNCGIKVLYFLNNQTQLSTLYLNDNHISEFNSFKNTKELRHLSLINNDIEKPFSIESYPSIHVVDLSGNKFGNKKFIQASEVSAGGTIKELSDLYRKLTFGELKSEPHNTEPDFVFRKLEKDHHPLVSGIRIILLVVLLIIVLLMIKMLLNRI